MAARTSSGAPPRAMWLRCAATVPRIYAETEDYRMARTDDIKRDQLSPRQQQLHDDLLRSRPRKTLTGPFAVLIHSPDIAEPADRLVNYSRGTTKLGRRLIELIILLVVRDA